MTTMPPFHLYTLFPLGAFETPVCPRCNPLITLFVALNHNQVRQYAAYALVKVGQNSDVRKQVTEEGGLEPVLYLARTEEPEIQRETLACLCSLSFAEENKINITKYGGLPPVMSAIKSPDVETARMACCACANLCEVVENMDNIVDAGGIPALVQVCGETALKFPCCVARVVGVTFCRSGCWWSWYLYLCHFNRDS